jgi:hypothetical protein
VVEGFQVNDRRRAGRLIVGESVAAAKRATTRIPSSGIVVKGVGGDTNPMSRSTPRNTDEVVNEMRAMRRIAMRKQGSGAGGVPSGNVSGANLTFATGRPRDPMFYWRQNNLPFDVTKTEELVKIREFCRLLYLTHPIVAACVDIFTKFPLQGMELECKDDQLKDSYEQLFFEQLDYRNYLVDIGREYWITGEAWPLGSFNEQLGVWDDDELLNPNDVTVEKSPFLKDPRFLIKLPETLRKVINERSPVWEYNALVQNYPELVAYAGEDSLMPVSNMLLKQIRFKADTFHKRGLPILMRGFRALLQEEMLNAAMDAIADRLYTPLILVKLGASATDLGTETPWIPTQDDLMNFEEALDAALAGDFRVLTHHFATDMAPVFGRENMPDLTGDFERIEDRILQVFGLSRTVLQGADQGETYAADALNRDIVTQLLTHYQRQLQDFYRDRALIVAEAQGHYDYDVRGGKRYVKMEEIIEPDEETGEPTIVERPKLLVPELKFATMNLADEQVERQFLESLNQSGVPVPYRARIAGTGMDFDDMIEQRKTEQVALAVAEQETRRETFKALRDANLPIPEDLSTDFQPKVMKPASEQGGAGDMALPGLGAVPPDYPALAPTVDDLADQDEENAAAPEDQATGQGQVILMPGAQQPGADRPPESDEERGTMPKDPRSAKISKRFWKTASEKFAVQMPAIVVERYVPVDNAAETRLEHHYPEGKFGDVKHVGLRRYVDVPEDMRWKSEWDDEETA